VQEQKADLKEYKNQSQAGLINITYYTDPLCCWSWAFEPEWQKLLAHFDGKLTWHYCMGGLLPSWNNYHDEINSISRPLQMGPMWMHAAELTGVDIRHDIWAKDPPASSYPACIAVKCVELQSIKAAEQYLFLLREACMVKGENIAKQNVLTSTAELLLKDESIEFDIEKFTSHLLGSEGREAFRKDLQEVKYRGINRFPSLLIKDANRAKLVTGYRSFETIAEVLNELLLLR
jgi:putative protein-disulfide isomerase